MPKEKTYFFLFFFVKMKYFFLNSASPNIALQTLPLYLKYLVKHKKLKIKDVKINCGNNQQSPAGKLPNKYKINHSAY